MKKLVFACALAAMSAGVFAKEATLVKERKYVSDECMREWTPFALTVCGPVGLPWGFWDVNGLQVGVINSVYQFSGLQVGVINIAERAYGLQIGVVNVIAADDCPFLPVVNWSF